MIYLLCSSLITWTLLFGGTGVAVRQNVLIVTVEHIKTPGGYIHVALYDSEDNFLKTHCQSKTIAADKGAVSVIFEGLAPGQYALGVIHDSNGNGLLDTNLLGIPKEGFGFSNGSLGRFGPPKFDKAKFTWCGEKETVVVQLKYL